MAEDLAGQVAAQAVKQVAVQEAEGPAEAAEVAVDSDILP